MVVSTAEAAWTFRRSVARLLRRVTKRKDPHSAEAFEGLFAKDGWSALRAIHEAPRHGVIAGFAHHLGVKSLLDLGCGEGLLFGYLPRGIRYCGVDFSETAIMAAKAAFNDNATFEVADVETYVPCEQYDLIVLNEVLYSLTRPGRVLQQCLKRLQPAGHVIVSCDVTPEKDKIWPIVSTYLRNVDIVELRSTSGFQWGIRLLQPIDRGPTL